jgi:hypothetical protein
MAQHTSTLERLTSIVTDPHRKPLMTILYESLTLSVKSRRPAGFYFTGLLHKRGINAKDHVSAQDGQRIQDVLCDPTAADILHNKLVTYEFFRGRGIPLPRLVAHNFKERLFIEDGQDWTAHRVGADQDFERLLHQVMDRSQTKSLFIKPVNESGGVGATRFAESDQASRDAVSRLRNYLLTGSFLIQDEVTQHARLNELNRTSLNTVRIDTLRTAGSDAEIISALLRIGLAGSHVDNVAGGGVWLGIDLAAGTLNRVAVNKLSSGGRSFTAHPDSNVQFEGFQLPCFEEVKKLAVEAANIMPPAMIGWDIAISNNGPVLMEGNARYYDIQVSDIAYGGYRKNQVFQKALRLARAQDPRIRAD